MSTRFQHLTSHDGSSDLGWLVLRIVLAGLIAAHGWVRWLGGGEQQLGEFLSSQGLPSGDAIAAAITAVEILGTLLLVSGRWIAALAVIYTCIYATGIYMVHAEHGWFVVGKGRNGVEYSVLLIAALLCVGLQHLPRRRTGG